jgi:very-short-patch-repair endonuclease
MNLHEKLRNSKYNDVIHSLVHDDKTVWFCAKDVADVMGIGNVHKSVSRFHKCDKRKFEKDTNGGPQSVLYLSENGLKRVLANSRKNEANDLMKALGLNVHHIKYSCIEADVLRAIEETFVGQEMIKQYSVDKYFIDLYMPKNKLAIECDEHNHKFQEEKDREREKKIKELIPDIVFIRLNPDSDDFNVYHGLNMILRHIINK